MPPNLKLYPNYSNMQYMFWNGTDKRISEIQKQNLFLLSNFKSTKDLKKKTEK